MSDTKTPLNSLAVASHIATVCDQKGCDWNSTKIQKLLYCCYGCVLAGFNERLCDEYPRAWQYGPVFPKVFNHIKKGKPFPLKSGALDTSEEMKQFLEKVIDVFGRYSAGALTAWSHHPDSPWDIVVNKMDAPNSFIPDDLICRYFLENKIVRPDTPNARN
jgi:uncharacterized phage-associated protein